MVRFEYLQFIIYFDQKKGKQFQYTRSDLNSKDGSGNEFLVLLVYAQNPLLNPHFDVYREVEVLAWSLPSSTSIRCILAIKEVHMRRPA